MKGSSNKNDIGYSSIGKVRQILDCFTFHKPALTMYQIADKVDMPTSSLYRYLQAMVVAGLLSHNKQANLYSIGMDIVEFAGVSLMQYEIRYAALPEMTVLSAQTDMNANLSILDGCDVFHLAYSIRYYATPWVDAIGRRTPAYQTAMGMSMLAYRPFEEVEELIRSANVDHPDRYPLPDFDQLKDSFVKIRTDQVAVMHHSVIPSIESACLASPIRRRNSEICAAVSVNWYRENSRENYLPVFEKAKPLLLQSAARISYNLGYIGRSYGTTII